MHTTTWQEDRGMPASPEAPVVVFNHNGDFSGDVIVCISTSEEPPYTADGEERVEGRVEGRFECTDVERRRQGGRRIDDELQEQQWRG